MLASVYIGSGALPRMSLNATFHGSVRNCKDSSFTMLHKVECSRLRYKALRQRFSNFCRSGIFRGKLRTLQDMDLLNATVGCCQVSVMTSATFLQ